MAHEEVGLRIDISQNNLRLLGEAFSFGLTLAISMALAFFAGSFLDRQLGWSVPGLTILLVMLALVGSFVRFIRNINRLSRENAKSSQRGKEFGGDDADRG